MKQVDFESDNVIRMILTTATPMLVAQVINLLYSVVDRVYIGRIPGTGSLALGGIGLTLPVLMIITGFTNMFGQGGSPLFAMALGEKDDVKADAILHTAFRLLLCTAIALTVLGEIAARPLLVAFGGADEMLSLALPYLRVYLTGTLFAMLSTGLNPFINAEGFPTIGMTAVVIGAVTNLILDPVFIFTFGMGVKGAAYATVLAQALSAFFTLRFLRSVRSPHRIRFAFPKKDIPAFPYARDIISLGVAPFVMQCTNSAVQITCNRVLLTYGSAVFVSIMTIINSVRHILDVPVLAFAAGTSPAISYNYGAKSYGRMKQLIKWMTIICVSYCLFSWVLAQLFPGAFIAIFNNDAEIRAEAVHAMRLYFLAFVFQSFQLCGQETFKSLGKKRQAIFFSVFRKVIMVVPLTFLLPLVTTPATDGVFLAEPVSNFVGGMACYITMLFTVRREVRKSM